MKPLSPVLLALAVITNSAIATVPDRIIDGSKDIKAGSALGSKLIAKARRLDNNYYDESFVADYSIKFQGCHHVQQWNADADDEDDVRVKTKRLVRFRLCPSDSCSNSKSVGCTSKFGDYVVDMNTFVESYLEAIDEEKDEICTDASEDCQAECDGSNNYNNCIGSCYDAYDVSYCSSYFNDDDGEDGDDEEFDPQDYAECAQFDFGRRRKLSADENEMRQLDNDIEYYIGPYCAEQGGEVHLGLFTEETCTTYASNGESMFYNYMGYELPYSDNSLISSRCFACGVDEGYGYNELKEVCQDIYDYSGKCETRMSSTDYPNESSCSYIEGIKIIREDGVIRTSTVKKSKVAAVCIGLFLTLGVLLAGYVYYLRTKLGRAQINLAAASQSLT